MIFLPRAAPLTDRGGTIRSAVEVAARVRGGGPGDACGENLFERREPTNGSTGMRSRGRLVALCFWRRNESFYRVGSSLMIGSPEVCRVLLFDLL